TYSLREPGGTPLNPSPFISHISRLFPSLPVETLPTKIDWRDCEHVSELSQLMFKMKGVLDARAQEEGGGRKAEVEGSASESTCQEPESAVLRILGKLPQVKATMESLSHFANPELKESLRPDIAEKLYGPVLRSSVSRLEQFAACPFQF